MNAQGSVLTGCPHSIGKECVMMRRKILFALGVVVLIITLFGLCGML